MCPVATAIDAAGGGACPTPGDTIDRPGNYTTTADANGEERSVALDLLRPETYATALDGVAQVFLSPPLMADRDDVGLLIDACVATRVRKLVVLWSRETGRLNAASNKAMEAEIRRSGLCYVMLRSADYMQSWETALHDNIAKHDRICVPAGAKPSALVDMEDVAAVVAAALTGSHLDGDTLCLTGPAVFDIRKVVQIMSEVLGRCIRQPRPSLVPFAHDRARTGGRGGEAVMSAIHAAFRFEPGAKRTNDVWYALGRPPHDFRTYVTEQVCRFVPTVSAADRYLPAGA